MKARTYQETIKEINHHWQTEGSQVSQDDGFSKTVLSSMHKVAEEKFIGNDQKNKFYGEVYREVKKEFDNE